MIKQNADVLLGMVGIGAIMAGVALTAGLPATLIAGGIVATALAVWMPPWD